jgi:hypothetical protein
MDPNQQKLLIMQTVFGSVLVIFGMMMLFFMQSQSIIIVYIAVALLCFTHGLTQLLASLINWTQKSS